VKENSIRRAVRAGRAALGTGLKEFATRGVPRIIEASGFDYCMIDMEHGAFDLEFVLVTGEVLPGSPRPETLAVRLRRDTVRRGVPTAAL